MLATTLNDINVKIDGASYFQKLRHEMPVYFDEGYRAFVVSRHKDLNHVLKEAVLFSSAKAIFSSYNYEDIVNAILDEKAHGKLVEVLPMTDPPVHTRVRAMVNLAFSSKRVATIQGFIESLSNELFDEILEKGEIEVVSAFAKPLPVATIAELLCLPRERWEDIIRWTTAYSSCAGNLLTSEEHATKIGNDLAEMENFIFGQMEERRRNPGDDVFTDLLNAKAGDYEPLTDKEILAIAAAFVGAGHESTTVAITDLFKLFADFPHLADDLRATENQDAAIRTFVEEFLRMRPPLNAQPRVTTADTELGGVAIPAGSMVIVLNASANRDEEIFGEDSEEFRIDRKNANRHNTFGGGVHMCLGNMLARAELHAVTKGIVNRIGAIRLIDSKIPQSDYGPAIMDWNYHLKRLNVSVTKRD